MMYTVEFIQKRLTTLLCALMYLAFSWLYKEEVKGLLQQEEIMVYADLLLL